MKIRALVILIGITMPAAWIIGADPGEYALVKNGQPMATIVQEAQPTKAAQMAAFELQEYLLKITGTRLPAVVDAQAAAAGHVRIYVGESARTREVGLSRDAFQPREYTVRFLPGEIFLVGKDHADPREVVLNPEDDLNVLQTWPSFWDERGTLNAMYDFLERFCGVRWFNPTDTGTECPESKTLVIKGRDIRRTPFFRSRDGTFMYGDFERYEERISLWPANR